MKYLRRIVILGMTAMAGASALPAAEMRGELIRLFAAGEKNTTPSVDRAREIALALKRDNLQDMRIDYAYGVVLANQRRYAEAARLIGRYLASQPEDLSAHRAKLWAEMQQKQYESALAAMDHIAELLLAERNAGPQQLDTVRYLGTCFGYLEHVQPQGIDEKIVSARRSALLTRLGEGYLTAFDQGWQAVASMLDQLEEQRDARLQRVAEDDAKKADKIAADLNDAIEKRSAQRETSESSAEKAKESQRELRVIQQQLNSIAPDRARLSAQITALQVQLTELQSPTTETTTNPSVVRNRNLEAPRPGDVFVGRTTQSTTSISLDRLAQAQAIALALAALNKQAFDMDRTILSLQTRGAELAGTSQVEFKKLWESQAAAEKAAQKAYKLSKQLERQELKEASQPPRMTGPMMRFSTYAPLPYEQETQRVLGWFEK